MTGLLIIIKFGGGLILLFALGWLVGQRIRFNKHIKY